MINHGVLLAWVGGVETVPKSLFFLNERAHGNGFAYMAVGFVRGGSLFPIARQVMASEQR